MRGCSAPMDGAATAAPCEGTVRQWMVQQGRYARVRCGNGWCGDGGIVRGWGAAMDSAARAQYEGAVRQWMVQQGRNARVRCGNGWCGDGISTRVRCDNGWCRNGAM